MTDRSALPRSAWPSRALHMTGINEHLSLSYRYCSRTVNSLVTAPSSISFGLPTKLAATHSSVFDDKDGANCELDELGKIMEWVCLM